MDWHGLWIFLNNWGVFVGILALFALFAIEELFRMIFKMYKVRQDRFISVSRDRVCIAELELKKAQERNKLKFYTVDDVEHEGYKGMQEMKWKE